MRQLGKKTMLKSGHILLFIEHYQAKHVQILISLLYVFS